LRDGKKDPPSNYEGGAPDAEMKATSKIGSEIAGVEAISRKG
jgi:hypothetical protein